MRELALLGGVNERLRQDPLNLRFRFSVRGLATELRGQAVPNGIGVVVRPSCRDFHCLSLSCCAAAVATVGSNVWLDLYLPT